MHALLPKYLFAFCLGAVAVFGAADVIAEANPFSREPIKGAKPPKSKGPLPGERAPALPAAYLPLPILGPEGTVPSRPAPSAYEIRKASCVVSPIGSTDLATAAGSSELSVYFKSSASACLTAVASNVAWISVELNSPSNSILLSLEPNSGSLPRTGDVNVVAGNQHFKIRVRQAAPIAPPSTQSAP